MNRIAFLFLFFLYIAIAGSTVAQDVQWASQVIEYSSQYGDKAFSAKQVLGKPNSLTYGKSMVSWAQSSEEAGKEFIKVGFAVPINVQQVAVMENLNPGAISNIVLYDEKGKDYEVYKNQKPVTTGIPEARMFRITIPRTSYRVTAVKVVLQSDAVKGMNQIDAIGISGSNVPIEAKINIKQYSSPVPPPQNLGRFVNSEYDDMLPIISPDNKTLYFARKNSPENYGGTGADDIYVSKRDLITGQWQKATNVGTPLNDADHNFVCAVSVDGQRLYLANSYKANGGGDGVSISTLKNGVWSKPQFLNIRNMYNKSPFACYHVSVDENYIVMAIERDDTYGDMDLYVSSKYADGTWSEPMNLGSILNTAGAEASVFLAADGKSLYFSSNGHPGYGDFDMYMTTRLDNTWKNWSEPVNLGSEINTIYRDFYYTIPGNGEYAYFATDFSSYGKSDLFRLALPKEIQPEKNSGLFPGGDFPSTANNSPYPQVKPNSNGPATTAPPTLQTSNNPTYDDKLEQLKAQLEKAKMQQNATNNAIENKNQQISQPNVVNNTPYTAPTTPVTQQPTTPKDNYTVGLEKKLAALKAQRETLNNPNYQPPKQNTNGNNTYNPYSTADNWNNPTQQPNITPANTNPALKPYEQVQPNQTYNDKLAELKAQRDNVNFKPEAPKAKDIPVDNTKPAVKYTPPTNTNQKPPEKSPEVLTYEEKLAKLKGEQYQQPTQPTSNSKPGAQDKPVVNNPANINNPAGNNTSFVEYPDNGKDFVYNPDQKPTINTPTSNTPTIQPQQSADVDKIQQDLIEQKEQLLKQQIAFSQDIETQKKLQAELDKLQAEKDQLHKEAQQLQQNNQQLQTQTNQLQTQNQNLTQEKQQLDNEIAKMEAEKAKIEQQKWELEQEKKMLEYQKNKQQQEIEKLQKEIAALQQQPISNVSAQQPNTSNAENLDFVMPLEVGATSKIDKIFFAANIYTIKPASYPQLDKIAAFLKSHNTLKVEIGGHTNGLCDDDFCKNLSTNRAKAIVDYLVSKGIAANRLTYFGYGKTKPIVVDVNNKPTGSEINQRVEIKILALE